MKTFYKLVRIINGKLYPLYVNATKEIPVGKWLQAEPGQLAKDGKHVKSRIGQLAFRPVWHGCKEPKALHIGALNSAGKVAYRRPNEIWVRCEGEGLKEIRRPKGQIWVTAERIKVTEILGHSDIDLPLLPA